MSLQQTETMDRLLQEFPNHNWLEQKISWLKAASCKSADSKIADDNSTSTRDKEQSNITCQIKDIVATVSDDGRTPEMANKISSKRNDSVAAVDFTEFSCRKKSDIENTSTGLITKKSDQDLTERSNDASCDNVTKFKIVSVYSVDKNTFVNDAQDNSDNKDFVVCNIRDRSTNAFAEENGSDADDDDDNDNDGGDDNDYDDDDDDDDAENTLVISEESPDENALESVDGIEPIEECDEAVAKSNDGIIQCSVVLTRSDYLTNFNSGQSRCIEETDNMNGVTGNDQRQESVAISTLGCLNTDVEKSTRDTGTPCLLTDACEMLNSDLAVCVPKEDAQVPSPRCPTDEGYDDTEVPESDLLCLPIDDSIAVVTNSNAPSPGYDKIGQGPNSTGDLTFDGIIEPLDEPQHFILAPEQGAIHYPIKDHTVGNSEHGNPTENMDQRSENADATTASQKSLALLALDLINSRDESQAVKSDPAKLLPSSNMASVDNQNTDGKPVVTITLSDTEACEDDRGNSDLSHSKTSAETSACHENAAHKESAAPTNLESPIDLTKTDKMAADFHVDTEVATPTIFAPGVVERPKCNNPKTVCQNTMRNTTVRSHAQFPISNSPIVAFKKQSPFVASQIAHQPKTSIFNSSQAVSGCYVQSVRDGQESMPMVPSNGINRAYGVKRRPSMEYYNMELQSKMSRKETIPLRETQFQMTHHGNWAFTLGSPMYSPQFPSRVLSEKKNTSALLEEFQKMYAEPVTESNLMRNVAREKMLFRNSSYQKGIAVSGRAMPSDNEMVWIEPQLNSGHRERNNNMNVNYRPTGSSFSRVPPNNQTGPKTMVQGPHHSFHNGNQCRPMSELHHGKVNTFPHDVNASCYPAQTKHLAKETFPSYGPQAGVDHMHGHNGAVANCENEMEPPSVAQTPSSQQVQGKPRKPPPAHSNAVRYQTWIPHSSDEVVENLSFKSSQPVSKMILCSSSRSMQSLTTTGRPDPYKNSRPANVSMSRPSPTPVNKPHPTYPNAHLLPKTPESFWSAGLAGQPRNLHNQPCLQKSSIVSRNTITDNERIHEGVHFGVPGQFRLNCHQMAQPKDSAQHDSGFKSLPPPPPYEHAIMADKREPEMPPPNLISAGYNKQNPSLKQLGEYCKNMAVPSAGMLSMSNSFDRCSANPYTQAYHDCLPKVMPGIVGPNQYSSVNPGMPTPSQFAPQNQRFEKSNDYTSHQRMIVLQQSKLSSMGQCVRDNMQYPTQPRMSQMLQIARPTAQWPQQVNQASNQNTVARFPGHNQHLRGSLITGQASPRHYADVQSRRCAVCPGPAEFLCGRCQNIWYCTKHCQTEDWRLRHRHVCSI